MDINIVKFDQCDIVDFINAFEDKSGSKGWKIKVNGEFIKTNSGKSTWEKKGHAKNALKNHFGNLPHNECLYYKLEGKYLEKSPGYKARQKLWILFIDYLQTKGILEFIELT